MNKHRCKWLGLVVLSFATFLVMGGCGGGGSKQPAKATIKGAVSFPSTTLSLNALVSKRVGSMVPDATVTVKAYTLDGKEAGSSTPTYDDTAATRVYEYSISNLSPNVDYVIKATKSGAVLKKLIEKKDASGTLDGQNLNSVSTAAVIVASNQLGAVLGDTLPAGKTVTDLSTSIKDEIKPALLEATIESVVAGGKDEVTTEDQAAFANVYNIVVTAGSEGKDPAALFIENPTVTLTNDVPILTVSGGVATATTIPVDATVIADNTVPVYTPPTETAATYNALAKVNLAAQDISGAALNYEKALVIAPNDPEANFGGAITNGMMMMEDPDVQTIITKWGAVVPTVNQVVQGTSPIKLPFGNMTSIKFTPKTTAKSVGSVATATTTQNVLAAFSVLKAKLPQQKSGYKSLAKTLNSVPDTAPSISEMQTLINNVIIPRIDKINARLAKAETATFSFTITKAMQGNPVNGTDETLNAGELYTLDAALNVFQVLFKIAGSYHFDIPTTYTYDTIGQDPLALINNPTTLTLNTGGAARMLGALDNARAAAAKAKLAYDKVVTRAAGVGMFDLASWTLTDKTDFTNGLTKVTGALAGPYDLSTNSGTKIVKIDATKFFTNPLTRANLPTFAYDVPRNATVSATYNRAVAAERTVTNYYQTYDATTSSYSYLLGGTRKEAIECGIVPISDLPDYTLNGILPGNTSANNVAEFNGILPMKAGVLFHSLVSGVPNYDYASLNINFGYATDNTSLYRLRQTVGETAPIHTNIKIQQIDPATGEVTNLTNVDDGFSKIVYANGQLWVGKNNNNPATGQQVFELYKFTDKTTTPWTLSTTPDISIPTYQDANGWSRVQSLSGSGNFVYYVLDKGVSTGPGYYDYAHSSEIHKLDMTNPTNLASDTSITLPADTWIENVAVNNNFLYTSGDGIEKRDASTGAVVARYANGNFDVMIGGYFYTNKNGKLIKFAGTPAGGSAEAALAKYFGF